MKCSAGQWAVTVATLLSSWITKTCYFDATKNWSMGCPATLSGQRHVVGCSSLPESPTSWHTVIYLVHQPQPGKAGQFKLVCIRNLMNKISAQFGERGRPEAAEEEMAQSQNTRGAFFGARFVWAIVVVSRLPLLPSRETGVKIFQTAQPSCSVTQ